MVAYNIYEIPVGLSSRFCYEPHRSIGSIVPCIRKIAKADNEWIIPLSKEIDEFFLEFSNSRVRPVRMDIGNKRKNMVTAAALLAERAGDVLSLSSFYETEPWGFASENTFLNAALELETACSPMELLHLTQQIEREMGRTQKSDGSYHDRIIDIDILLYGNEVVHHEDLFVPHPLMQQRLFVMQPLAEIAPSLVHPVLQKSMYDLYMDLLDGEDSEVK